MELEFVSESMRDDADTGENYKRMNFCENGFDDVEITPLDVWSRG